MGGQETRDKVRTRGVLNGHKEKAFNYEDCSELEEILEGLCSFFLQNLSRSDWRNPRANLSDLIGDPALRRNMDKKTSWCPLQPEVFHALKELFLSSQGLCQTKQIVTCSTHAQYLLLNTGKMAREKILSSVHGLPSLFFGSYSNKERKVELNLSSLKTK